MFKTSTEAFYTIHANDQGHFTSSIGIIEHTFEVQLGIRVTFLFKMICLTLLFLTGLSCKTQEIYMLVFCMRYVDLFMYFISVYNTSMKIFFISATGLIIYLMRFKKPFCTTYDALGDAFPHFKILIPAAAVLTAICHSGTSYWELCWSFSLWLESLAFIPQIIMLQKIRIIENLTSHYVAMLGMYRLFYIVNW